MKAVLSSLVALFLFAGAVLPAEKIEKGIVPGTLVVVGVKHGTGDVKAKASDLIEFQIANPALAKRVTNVNVTTEGAVRKAAVVNTGVGIPGGSKISVFVAAEKPG